MICPRCNTRNALGNNRCVNCGHPFTRRAARHRSSRAGFAPPPSGREPVRREPPAARPPVSRTPPPYYDAAPDYGQPRRHARTYQRSHAPGNKALGGLFAFLIVVIVVIAVAAILSSGNNTTNITDGVADRASQLVGASDDGDEPPVEVPEAPAEPAGDSTWVLTQDELNARIAARSGSFGPARDVRLELNEGTVTIRFRAHGINGTYHGSLVARDGIPVVADSTIDGPLGWVVSSSVIDDVLNEEIARAVGEQRVSVESVHVQPGQVVFGIYGG
jgi:hypothetical protein